MVSKYTKKKLTELKGELDKSTIKMGDFNMFLSITERDQAHRNICMNMEHWKNTINKLDIINIYDGIATVLGTDPSG